MRWLHTADWHLGRIFHSIHLTEDQAYVLDQFVDLARQSNPDAILVSGDIYDRAVPPPEAVSLLDDVLSRLVLDLKIPVILSAGNHDSPDRLGFGSRLLAGEGLHVIGTLAPDPAEIVLHDADGPVHIYALPYAEPAVVREKTGDANVSDHHSAMSALVTRIRQKPEFVSHRTVLMGHAYVAGGEGSESERPLSIGGTGSVDASLFEGFDYVALGHLHQPQRAGADNIEYSGSLMKYSFSEATHAKSIHLVEMDASGTCRIEKVALKPKRDVRCIEGMLGDILTRPAPAEKRDDYLMVTLHDTGAILDAMGKLRDVYPNVLHIERPELMEGGRLHGNVGDHRKMQDMELFDAFFSEVTSEPLSSEQSIAFTKAVDTLRRMEREAA